MPSGARTWPVDFCTLIPTQATPWPVLPPMRCWIGLTQDRYLIQASRTYIFTTASLPAVSHALQTSLDLIEGAVGQQRRRHLLALQHQLRAGLTQVLNRHAHMGWQLTNSPTPVQPLIVGSNDATMALSSALETAGLRVPGIRPPTVPQGQARLRITLCATHTAHDIDRLVHAVAVAAQGLERP